MGWWSLCAGSFNTIVNVNLFSREITNVVFIDRRSLYTIGRKIRFDGNIYHEDLNSYMSLSFFRAANLSFSKNILFSLKKHIFR